MRPVFNFLGVPINLWHYYLVFLSPLRPYPQWGKILAPNLHWSPVTSVEDPDPNSLPVVIGMDPRIRIRTKMTWIRIRDVYPGSRILIFTHPGSRIPDSGSKSSNERQGWKKIVVIPFVGAINFTKFNYFNFELLKTKIRANFQRIIELFTQKIVTKLSKYGSGIRDRRSGIQKNPIPDPGVKKAPDPDPQHWKNGIKAIVG